MPPKLKLYQTVAQKIEQGIQDGSYRPGTRLPPERDLAETFAVSRPTVREAIIALEIRTLAEVKHGSGVYVVASPPAAQPASELDVGAFELIEARLLFEGEAAALAARTLTPDTLDQLGDILRRMEAAEPASAEELALDRSFHLAIAQATQNT